MIIMKYSRIPAISIMFFIIIMLFSCSSDNTRNGFDTDILYQYETLEDAYIDNKEFKEEYYTKVIKSLKNQYAEEGIKGKDYTIKKNTLTIIYDVGPIPSDNDMKMTIKKIVKDEAFLSNALCDYYKTKYIFNIKYKYEFFNKDGKMLYKKECVKGFL